MALQQHVFAIALLGLLAFAYAQSDDEVTMTTFDGSVVFELPKEGDTVGYRPGRTAAVRTFQDDIDEAKDMVVSQVDAVDQRVKRETECAGEDRDAIYTKIVSAFTDVQDDMACAITTSERAMCKEQSDKCAQDLTGCMSNTTACVASLASSEGLLSDCQADKAQCMTDKDVCTTDLGSCSTDKAISNGLLAACNTAKGTCDTQQTQCVASLATCEGSLQGKTAEAAAWMSTSDQATQALTICNMSLWSVSADRDDLRMQLDAALEEKQPTQVVCSDEAQVIGITFASCPDDGCSPNQGDTVSVFATGTLVPSTDAATEAIYKCHFLRNYDQNEMMTPATITKVADNLYRADCNTPLYGLSVDRASFSADVTLLAFGNAVPVRNEEHPFPKVTFKHKGAALEIDGAIDAAFREPNAGEETVLSFDAILSDPDTALDKVTMTFTSSNNDLVPAAKIKISGAGPDRQLSVTLANNDEVHADYMETTITITFTDVHATSVQTFKITTYDFENDLAFALANDGGLRSYSDAFWTDSELYGSQESIASVTSIAGDIKTKYYDATLGKRIKMVAWLGSSIMATAYYNVKPAYQGKTLRSLLTGTTRNVVFADKDVLSSVGKGAIQTRLYSIDGRQGNNNPEIGDMFFDFDDSLMAHQDQYGNTNTAKMRLGTNQMDRGAFGPPIRGGGNQASHVYAGIGGSHKRGGWCIEFEYEPIVGYCGTYHRYGNIYRLGPSGCSHHPYGKVFGQNGCGETPTRTAMQVAMYLHVRGE